MENKKTLPLSFYLDILPTLGSSFLFHQANLCTFDLQTYVTRTKIQTATTTTATNNWQLSYRPLTVVKRVFCNQIAAMTTMTTIQNTASGENSNSNNNYNNDNNVISKQKRSLMWSLWHRNKQDQGHNNNTSSNKNNNHTKYMLINKTTSMTASSTTGLLTLYLATSVKTILTSLVTTATTSTETKKDEEQESKKDEKG